MTDVRLQSALARLAPQVDDVSRWDDVVRRAGVGPRIRWRLGVVAVAMLVTAGVVVGALAAGLFGGSLDRLGAWVGDQPGDAAPEQQAAFDRENSLAYARFPKGTRIGRLVQIEFEGRKYELFGFRDGSNLCLHLVPLPVPRQNPPQCVPARELRRIAMPIAAVGGHLRARLPDGSGLTMLYGLANDAVSSVEVIEKGRPLGQAAVGNNAFLFAVADHPRFTYGGPPIVLRARDDREVIADVPLETGPIIPDPALDPTALPGPDAVKPALTNGSIGWLDRGEPRGEPFRFPRHGPLGIVESRLLQPDPASSFRIGVARAEGTDRRTQGGWYCLSWLWPLIRGSSMSMCSRDDSIETGLFYSASLMSSAVQFPLWVGLAADEVARLELYHRDGSFDVVSIVDNAFSFQTARGEALKLVAYDEEDRVIRIEVVGGVGSGLGGYSMGF